MSANVRPMGPVRQGSGVVYVACTGVPYAGVVWRLTGAGALTPTRAHADAGGVATAKYVGAPAAGTAVHVEVDVYA